MFIARALPEYLVNVSPAEAVEYVLPLLNGLGTDQGKLPLLQQTFDIYLTPTPFVDETVKEAFVEKLATIMWWFFLVRIALFTNYSALFVSILCSHDLRLIELLCLTPPFSSTPELTFTHRTIPISPSSFWLMALWAWAIGVESNHGCNFLVLHNSRTHCNSLFERLAPPPLPSTLQSSLGPVKHD